MMMKIAVQIELENAGAKLCPYTIITSRARLTIVSQRRKRIRGKTLENGSVVPLEVKEGDRILFGKYSGTEIKLQDEDYLILREDEIVGILTHAGKAAGKK